MKRNKLGLIFLGAMIASTAWAADGVLEGTVKLKKKWGAAKPENVMVWLSGGEVTPAGDGAKTHTIATRKKAFSPSHLIIQPGDKVVFPNYDPFKHNVFSSAKENPFDLGAYGKGAKPGHTFNQEGVVQIYCNVHPDMAAFIVVAKSPWTQVTDKSGGFSFKGIPPGSYELNVWHIRGSQKVPLTITPGGTVTQDVVIETANYKPTPHLNKNGKKYPRSFGNDESY